MEVAYYWYDHLLLRQNGDAKRVQKAIADKDWPTFMRFKKKYGKHFLPDCAFVIGEDEEIEKEIDIRIKENFEKITFSEYECG